MKKILIIGKKSFIGSNLKKYLTKYFNIDTFSYEKIIYQNEIFFKKYSHIINTSIHPYYQRRKYNEKFESFHLRKEFSSRALFLKLVYSSHKVLKFCWKNSKALCSFIIRFPKFTTTSYFSMTLMIARV